MQNNLTFYLLWEYRAILTRVLQLPHNNNFKNRGGIREDPHGLGQGATRLREEQEQDQGQDPYANAYGQGQGQWQNIQTTTPKTRDSSPKPLRPNGLSGTDGIVTFRDTCDAAPVHPPNIDNITGFTHWIYEEPDDNWLDDAKEPAWAYDCPPMPKPDPEITW